MIQVLDKYGNTNNDEGRVLVFDKDGNIKRLGGGGGSGTVTSVSVTNGTGISASVANPTTTPNITITNTAPDQTVVLNNGTGISVTGTYPNFTITNSSPSSGGTVTGSGVATRVAFWDTTSSLSSNSELYWDSTNKRLGIGSTPSGYNLEVNGNGYFGNDVFIGNGSKAIFAFSDIYIKPELIGPAWEDLAFYTNNTEALRIKKNSSIIVSNLAGTGTRMVVANATGLLSTQTIPAGTVTAVTASAPLASSGGTAPDISIPQASSSINGYLSSTDWNIFDGKQNALTLTTTGTSGAATLIGSTLNIPQYSGGGGSAAGSTGNIQYNNGGAFAGSNNLFWDDANTRLGIAQSTPTSRFHLNFNQNSVTQNDANGILLANTSAATSGLQSISPPLVWQGNGFTSGSTSQDVRFRAFTLPIQGGVNPSASWNLESSINGGAYGTALTYRSNGVLNAPIFYASNQFLTGTSAGNAPYSYRTTNAGGDITPTAFFGTPANTTAGTISIPIESNNGLVFAASNGTRHIARASINIASLTNTAAAESGDMAFLTQSGGGLMFEKMRIFAAGNVGIGTSTNAGYKLDVNGTGRVQGNTVITQNLTVTNQIKNGTAAGQSFYKTTNAGSFQTPQAFLGYTETNTVGFNGLAVDFVSQSGLLFIAPNGSVNGRVLRAGIGLATPSNTPGAESGDLLFSTQSGGTVMTEKMRITSVGRVGVGINPVTKFQVDLTNTDFTNTAGANSHFLMTNPSATGQNVVASYINGALVAKWRTDYVGNISWVAGSTGAHDFYTKGDYAVGNIQMRIFNNGNVQIATSPVGGANADAGYKLDVQGTARVTGALNFNPTNTPAGTTGNQTINKTSGTVNIAAAGTSITVTNSLVTTSSIVFATIRTNDATAVIKNVVPAAGSFTINLNAAATAETSIGFFVIN